jgi:hypothetical protein
LLVVGEQGFGDNIQFARFIPSLNADKIYFAPRKELITLFQTSNEISTAATIIDASNLPEVDAWIPIMELAAICGANDKTVPFTSGYLPSHKKDMTDILKIGLVWQGNPSIARLDKLRSLTLSEFRPLFDIKNVEFISLQQGYGKEQLDEYRDFIKDSGVFSDFLATTKAIDELDLVITIDSSVAHLSAAMNKPTWILLPYVSCWRWGMDTKQSYWYDSVKLFRQTSPNIWQDVIQNIKDEITLFNK